MNRPLHALIYCHAAGVSRVALALQEHRCRRKALRLGATETITLMDRDAGRGADRPAMRRLRALLVTGCIDVVVVDTPARISAHPADVDALRREVAQAGARLVFVTDEGPRTPKILRHAPASGGGMGPGE